MGKLCYPGTALPGQQYLVRKEMFYLYLWKRALKICQLCSASMPSVAIIQHHSKALYVVNDVKGGFLALKKVASTMC